MESKTKKRLFLISGIIISLLVTLLLGFYGFNYVEGNLKTLLFASGASLSRTVTESSRSVFLLQSEKEKDLSNELYFKLSKFKIIDENSVRQLSDYPLVIMTDLSGNVLYEEHRPQPDAALLLKNFKELVRPIYEGDYLEYIFGIDPDFPGKQVPKGMAVRRQDHVLVVFARTGETEVNDRGLGYLIRDIAQEPGITYIVLQNPDGVMLASRGVNRISGFSSDSFLRDIYENNHARGKFRTFNGHKIYEVITPFPKMGEFYGVLRIGLSLQEYNAVIIALVVPLVAVFALLCLMTVLFINSRYLYRRVLQAESFREGITGVEHLVYLEFNGLGLVERCNKTAEHLLKIENGSSNITEILSEEIWSKLKGKGKIFQTGLHRNGKFFNLTAQKISISEENISRFYLLAEEVTELFDLRRRAEGLHHLEGLAELTSTIAHDIRNPLNAVSIAVQKMQMRITDDKNITLLKTMQIEISNLNRMVEDFLALSAPISLRRKTTNIAKFLDEIYQNATMFSSEKGIGIKLENLIEQETLELDSGRLKRAIGNIVKNGIEAAQDDSFVGIQASIDSSTMIISIENKGNVIPPDILPNLFRPVASGKSGGYGLGLFSAYRIVRTHKGDIGVTSENGTTIFKITIPID